MIDQATLLVEHTDEQLANQWLHALDQAERYGEQLAWLTLDRDADCWKSETTIRRAWSMFINQFDVQVHYLIREAFQAGFIDTWGKVQMARGLMNLN